MSLAIPRERPPGPRGHVPTPTRVVDRMVRALFKGRAPNSNDSLLDPGCGDGVFLSSVLNYCCRRSLAAPQMTGVELDPALIGAARQNLRQHANVKFVLGDLLDTPLPQFDYITGNPPYVPITGMSPRERQRYASRFVTAVERFDLYVLFFERCLRLLAPEGRLCLITPEKYEYVHSAAPLRRLLNRFTIETVEHAAEDTFGELVTYPTITTVLNHPPPRGHRTLVTLRDGSKRTVRLPGDGSSWNPAINGIETGPACGLTLEDVCIRVSCGIATGTDSVFVLHSTSLPTQLEEFAHPTISGRQLGIHGAEQVEPTSVMLIPYDDRGRLLSEDRLGSLRNYLFRPDIMKKLQQKTHVEGRISGWYRFHDNVPMTEIRQPKILCKDITSEPHFWADRSGEIIPRHSIYYLVPKPGVDLERMLSYLNGAPASHWLKANCQRAANGFYRLQSTVLKRLPVPENLLAGRSPVLGEGPRRGKDVIIHPRKQSVLTTFS